MSDMKDFSIAQAEFSTDSHNCGWSGLVLSRL